MCVCVSKIGREREREREIEMGIARLKQITMVDINCSRIYVSFYLHKRKIN